MARTSLESGMSSSKAAPKPKAKHSGGGMSNLDKGQKIKLAVSVGVIVLVAVFIVFQQGWISLGGQETPPSDVTPEQDREVKEAIEKAQSAPPPPPNAPVRTGSQ